MILSNNKTCCFIGHRKVKEYNKLKNDIDFVISELIKDGVQNFIFGDHSEFDDMCYDSVTEFKKTFPQIKRIHYRVHYPEANDYTMQFLLHGCEESIFPKGALNAGRLSYIKRNQAMITESDICVFYCDLKYEPVQKNKGNDYLITPKTKSGTVRAYNFAKSKNKKIINLYKE